MTPEGVAAAATVVTVEHAAAAEKERKAEPAGQFLQVTVRIDEQVEPVLVRADGSVSSETYPGSVLTGGFTVLELPTREDAVAWAGKIAAACRCAQELRAFMYDPAS